MEFAHHYRAPETLVKLHTRFSRRIPNAVYAPIWRDFNLAIGNFDVALKVSKKLSADFPENINHIAELSSAYFAAGLPEEGIQTIKDNHTTLLSQSSRQRPQMSRRLISANQIDWIKGNRPELIDVPPRLKAFLSEPVTKQPKIKTYCISLERDHRRLATTKFIVKSENIEFNTLTASLGTEITKEEYYSYFNADLPYPNVSPAEIGCSLSHMRAWQEIAENCADDEHGLVMRTSFLEMQGGSLKQLTFQSKSISGLLLSIIGPAGR